MTAFFESVTSTLALNDSATSIQDIIESSAQELELFGVVTSNILPKDISNNINFEQTVELETVFFIDILNTLTLTQLAEAKGALNKPISNSLNLTQLAETNIKAGIASAQLSLTQSVRVGKPISVAVSNSLLIGIIDFDDLLDADLTDPDSIPAIFEGTGLRHTVTTRNILNAPLTSHLSLVSIASNIPTQTPSNHIHLSHTVELIEHELVESRIYFSHIVVGDVVNPASSSLVLTQTLVPGSVFSRSVISLLNLGSGCSYYSVDLCGYNLGVGQGPGNILLTPPILTRRTTTILTYPFDNPRYTLTLRNPDFDNVEQFEPRRINRRTRGGKLDLYRNNSWPKAKRFIYTFSSLKEQDIEDMIEFLEVSLGQEIGLLDFESRQWKGIILTPSAAFSQPGIDKYQGALEFERTVDDELIVNGDFSIDRDPLWSVSNGIFWFVNNGVAGNRLGPVSGFVGQEPLLPLVEGTTYQVKYDVLSTTAGVANADVGGTNGISRTANGTYIENIIAGSAHAQVKFEGDGSWDGKFDNVSLMRV